MNKRNVFTVTNIDIPALDFDWYQNHLGKPVEGMIPGEMKQIQNVKLDNRVGVTLWFVNSSKLNPSYMMATLHTLKSSKAPIITDVRDYETVPEKIEFKNYCTIFVTRKEE